jgi:hypothetical protein
MVSAAVKPVLTNFAKVASRKLQFAVVVNFEVVLCETRDGTALSIADHHRHLHHAHLGAQSYLGRGDVRNGPRMDFVSRDGLSLRQGDTSQSHR